MRRPDPSVHRAALTRREALLFEAGVKLGGVFHQYLGIPVTPRTAPALARTIEEAIRLQPFVREARVTIRPRQGGPVGRGRFGYRYLTAEMLTVTVRLVDGPFEVRARLEPREDLHYPLMSVDRVRPRAGRRDRPGRSRSSAQRR